MSQHHVVLTISEEIETKHKRRAFCKQALMFSLATAGALGGMAVGQKAYAHAGTKPQGKLRAADNTPVLLYLLGNLSTMGVALVTDTSQIGPLQAAGYVCAEIAASVFPPSAQVTGTTGLYALFNPTSNIYFYTTDVNTVNELVATQGYTNQGIIGYVYAPTAPVVGTLPLYRVFNTTTEQNYFSTNFSVIDALLNSGNYTYGGVTAYVLP